MNNFYSCFSDFRFNKNNSFTCKRPEVFSCEETESLAVALLWESGLDFEIAGEDGCLNNFDMYTPLYNFKTGLLYLIPYSVSDEWKNGKEVTIYGREVDEEELKNISEFMEMGDSIWKTIWKKWQSNLSTPLKLLPRSPKIWIIWNVICLIILKHG